jgi:hypothetical protein
MKRLICNKSTQEFLSAGGIWSKEISSAQNFSDYPSAITAQRESRLENLQIVLIMEALPNHLEEMLPLVRRPR